MNIDYKSFEDIDSLDFTKLLLIICKFAEDKSLTVNFNYNTELGMLFANITNEKTGKRKNMAFCYELLLHSNQYVGRIYLKMFLDAFTELEENDIYE